MERMEFPYKSQNPSKNNGCLEKYLERIISFYKYIKFPQSQEKPKINIWFFWRTTQKIFKKIGKEYFEFL